MLKARHFTVRHLLACTLILGLSLLFLPDTVLGQRQARLEAQERLDPQTRPVLEGGAVTIGKVAVGDLTFHPLFNSLGVEREIASLIYGEGLLRVNESGMPSDGLAYLPIKLASGRDWVFRLKQGIEFHDGEPMTAADVIFTYTRYKAARVYDPVFHRYFQNIEKITALDKQTVRITMKSPIDAFPDRLATLPILPRHQLGPGLFADAGAHLETTRPIGLGPYRVSSWPVHDTVTLEANETWHQGRASLDRVVYRFYPTSESLQAAFIMREVDLIEVERDGTLKDLKRARSDAKIQAIVPGNRAFSAIFYNHRHPLLADSAIRRALTFATDRQRILEEVLVRGAGV
ncbi:MAG: ABC transporter substrate-binding protein, partial [Gemmatimonadota bacterium]|nr:ABC transporter substrate-binding protein [Gemmatimonadota bacterium]